MFRNIKQYCHIIYNVTRKTENFHMLESFNTIHRALISVADAESGTVTVDRSENFKKRAITFENKLPGIHQVNLKPENPCVSQSDWRMALDVLIKIVAEKRHYRSSLSYKCELEKKLMTANRRIARDSHFECGFVKRAWWCLYVNGYWEKFLY